MSSRIIMAVFILVLILLVYPPIGPNASASLNNNSYLAQNTTKEEYLNDQSRENQLEEIELEPIAISPSIFAVGLDNETGEVVISHRTGILCTKSLKGIEIEEKESWIRDIYDLPGEGKVGLYIDKNNTFYYIDCKNGTYDKFSLGTTGYPDLYKLHIWNNHLIFVHHRSQGEWIGNVVDLIFIENKTIIANHTIVADKHYPQYKLGYNDNNLLVYLPYNYTTSYLLVFDYNGNLLLNKTISVEYVYSAYGLEDIPGVLLVEINFTTGIVNLTAYIYDNGTIIEKSFTIPRNYTLIKSKLLEDSTLLLLLNNTDNGNLVAEWIRLNKSSFSIIGNLDLGIKWGYNVTIFKASSDNVLVIQKNPQANTTYIILGKDGIITNISDYRLNKTTFLRAHYLISTNTILLNLLYPNNNSNILYIKDLDTNKSLLIRASYLKTILGDIIYLKSLGIYVVRDNATIELYNPYLRVAFGVLPINKNLTARIVADTDGYVHLELLDNELNVLKSVKIAEVTYTTVLSYNSVFAHLALSGDRIYMFLSMFAEFFPYIKGYMYNMTTGELTKIQEYLWIPIPSNYLARGNGVIIFDYPSISLVAIEQGGKLYPVPSTIELRPSTGNTTILMAKNSIKLAVYHKSIDAFSVVEFRGKKLSHKTIFSALPLTWLYNDTYLIAYYLSMGYIVALDENTEVKYSSRYAAEILPGRDFIAWLYDNGSIISISDNGVFTYSNYTQAVSSPYSDYILAETNNTLYLLRNGEEIPLGKLPQNNTYLLMETTIPYVYGNTTGLFYRLNLSFLYNQTMNVEHYKWQIIPETPLNLSIIYEPPFNIQQCIWKSTTIRIVGEEPLPENYTVNLTLYYRNGETVTRNLIASGEMITIPISVRIQELLGVMLKARNTQGIFIPAACPGNDYKLLNSSQGIEVSPISAYVYRNETVVKLKYHVKIEQSYSLELGTSDDNWNLIFYFRILTLQANPRYMILATAKPTVLTIQEETTGKTKTISLNTSLVSYGRKLALKVENDEDTITITLPYLGNKDYYLSLTVNPPASIIYNERISLGNINDIPVQLIINGEILLPLKEFEKNITVNAKMLEPPESTTTSQETTTPQNTNTTIPEQTNNYTNTTKTTPPKRTDFLKTTIVIIVLLLTIAVIMIFLKRR